MRPTDGQLLAVLGFAYLPFLILLWPSVKVNECHTLPRRVTGGRSIDDVMLWLARMLVVSPPRAILSFKLRHMPLEFVVLFTQDPKLQYSYPSYPQLLCQLAYHPPPRTKLRVVPFIFYIKVPQISVQYDRQFLSISYYIMIDFILFNHLRDQ